MNNESSPYDRHNVCKMCNVQRKEHQNVKHFFVEYDIPVNWVNSIWEQKLNQTTPLEK